MREVCLLSTKGQCGGALLGRESRAAAAVEDGVTAFDASLKQLTNIPTPAGPTPRQLQETSASAITTKGGRDGDDVGGFQTDQDKRRN